MAEKPIFVGGTLPRLIRKFTPLLLRSSFATFLTSVYTHLKLFGLGFHFLQTNDCRLYYYSLFDSLQSSINVKLRVFSIFNHSAVGQRIPGLFTE